jgi:hypothetical protein
MQPTWIVSCPFFTNISRNLLALIEGYKLCKTSSKPVVLCGCETWSFILREEHKLRVFENRALRSIYGIQMQEVAGRWRRLHNEGLHNL